MKISIETSLKDLEKLPKEPRNSTKGKEKEAEEGMQAKYYNLTLSKCNDGHEQNFKLSNKSI